MSWNLGGFDFCASAFRHLLGNISVHKFYIYKIGECSGCPTPMQDGRKFAVSKLRDSPQHHHCSAWLQWCYDNMAEPLAETVVALLDADIPF